MRGQMMQTQIRSVIEYLRHASPLVRVFVFILIIGLVLKASDSSLDFYHAFARGFSDGFNGAHR